MKFTKHAIIALLTIFTQLLYSQTATDTTANKIITLGDAVISANKVEEIRKNVAQQVQVLTAEEIVNSQSQTTADLMANTGNVFVQKSQLGGGSLVIRGFEANRVLMVIDGVRMNNIIYRAGHLQNVVTIDNAMLDRTEILFGPSSTIYGSDALGGVVHFYTKKPLFANAGEKQNIKVNASTRYSTVDNEFNDHIDFNIGGAKLASLTSFTYSAFDDLKGGENQNPFYTSSYGEQPYYQTRIKGKDSLMKNDDRYLQVESGYSQYDILEKLAYKQNEHVTHGLNLQYSNSTDVPRYDRLTDPSASTGLRYAEWYYGPQTRVLAAYDLNINNAASLFQSIHAGVNFQNIEESRHNRSFGSSNRSNRFEKVNVLGANLDLNRIVGKHNLRFGLDAQYNTLKSTAHKENILTGQESPLDTRYPDGDNTMTNIAFFYSHTMKINDELTLNDGARIGYTALHSTLVDTALLFHLPYTSIDQSYPVYSGSLGIINTPSDDLKLSLLLSTGFRSPNLDDVSKIFESSPGAVIVPNEDLKPEKTFNTDLGITKIFNGKTSWENTIYNTQIYDAIVTDTFQFNGQDSILYDGTMSRVYANQNKRRAYIMDFHRPLNHSALIIFCSRLR